MFGPANCTNAPASTPSDAGIAGAGVLLSFIITAGLAMTLSASIIFQEIRGKPSVIRRKLLNGYSDQQLMTGIGIQSVGLARINTLVPYHFFIIWMLSLLSTSVHMAALLALVRDFRRDWVLRWLRQFLMFVNLTLSCVYGVFVLQAVRKDLVDKALPIGCVWEAQREGDAPSNLGVSYFGTIVVIALNGIVFILSTWYLHNRTQRFYKTIQIVGLVAMTASAIAAATRAVLASQAFGSPSVQLSDSNETTWSFGQLLSLLMLVLPVISAIEIMRGDIKVCQSPPDDGSELPMKTKPVHAHEFQPNPFFGSQTNLFKK